VDLDAPTPSDIAKEFRGYRDPDGPTHNELRRNELKQEVLKKYNNLLLEFIFTPIQSCILLLSSSLEQQEAGRSRD